MQRALLAWNAAGLALLFTILAIAVLSVPFPFQHFGRGPANLMVADFPFIWLPTWFIPVALYAHLASMRLAWGDLRQHRTARNSRRHTA
jgi:hypothetical protein